MEVYGIPGYTNGQSRVLIRMFHGVNQGFAAENIDIQMVRTLCKVTIENIGQVLNPLFQSVTQRIGHNRERIADTILAHIAVRDLRYRIQRSQCTGFIAAMHGVGTRCQRLAALAPVGRGPSLLAIHDVTGDGQSRQRVNRTTVQRMFLQLFTKPGHNVDGQVVGAVIIIPVFGEVPFNFEINGHTLFVADGLYLCIPNSRQAVRGYRKAGNTKSHQPLHAGVMQCHLAGFVGILVVHKVDNVVCIHIQLGFIFQYLFVVIPHLVVIQHFVGNGFNAGHNHFAQFFVHTAVDGIQEGFGHVAASPKELHLLAHFHGGHAAGNGVIVAIHRTHHIIVFVLHGIGLDRNFCAVFFKGFGQVFAPQHRHVGFRRRA